MRRLVSENNLTSVDNTAIENVPDKKLAIDCDPEFYLNNTLHRLPKNGIRLDYFGQMLNELFGDDDNDDEEEGNVKIEEREDNGESGEKENSRKGGEKQEVELEDGLYVEDPNITARPIEASQVSRGKKREFLDDDKEEQIDSNPNKKVCPKCVIENNKQMEIDENSYQQNPLLLLTEVALAKK